MSYQTNRLDEQVIKLLQQGAVGFMPSDTIYGLSCRALDKQAVERTYTLKMRDSNKPFIILISDIKMLDLLSISSASVESVRAYWPGALTLICDATSSPTWLHRGANSLAIRLPGNEELLNLISKVGPLVSTSANTQGLGVATSVTEAKKYFGEQLDFYVDGGDLSNSQPSTLVRTVDGKLEVIRQGAVKIKEDL